MMTEDDYSEGYDEAAMKALKDAEDEIERLREEIERLFAASKDAILNFEAMRDDLKKSEQENARLREALEPLSDEELNKIIEGAFAKLAKYHHSKGARGQTFTYRDSPEYWVVGTTIEHLRARAARAAIREGGREG